MTDTQILEQMGKDILALTAERDEARSDKAELQALFDMQHSRVREAEQLWRDNNPGNELVMPDLGKLVQWLVDDRIRYKADAERLAEALQWYAWCSDGCTCGDGWGHDIARAALAEHERSEG